MEATAFPPFTMFAQESQISTLARAAKIEDDRSAQGILLSQPALVDDSGSEDEDSSGDESATSVSSEEVFAIHRISILPSTAPIGTLDSSSSRDLSTLVQAPERPLKACPEWSVAHRQGQEPESIFLRETPRSAPIPIRGQQNRRVSTSFRKAVPPPPLLPPSPSQRRKSLNGSPSPPRSASVSMRHDAALRSFHAKRSDTNENVGRSESWSPARGDSSNGSSSSWKVSKKPEPLKTHVCESLIPSNITIVVGSCDEEDEVEEVIAPPTYPAPDPPRVSDERGEASRRLFKAIGGGGMKLGSKGEARRDGDQQSRGMRRPPSLDQISSRFNQSLRLFHKNSPTALGLGSRSPNTPGMRHWRSVSCPSPVTPFTHQFGQVEVIVTPPTPRPSETEFSSFVVPGVVLRSLNSASHSNPSSPGSDFNEIDSKLAAPPFDVAPGRQIMLDERMKYFKALEKASRESEVESRQRGRDEEGIGSPVPPKAGQAISLKSQLLRCNSRQSCDAVGPHKGGEPLAAHQETELPAGKELGETCVNGRNCCCQNQIEHGQNQVSQRSAGILVRGRRNRYTLSKVSFAEQSRPSSAVLSGASKREAASRSMMARIGQRTAGASALPM
ncbi:hypothetical protein IE53DRAFT_140896 [Violaceomyces palustris]|uniref:Uncharacterized protein n=1 Tax=Violaceomyces palustris TaxID=1673888 RepID=A0ACD0NUJ0_9BASI|nr:hypothetical protein IE53DRAFT_140896 [Violaceomyces palustris]